MCRLPPTHSRVVHQQSLNSAQLESTQSTSKDNTEAVYAALEIALLTKWEYGQLFAVVTLRDETSLSEARRGKAMCDKEE
jgi:hypothetical protein